MGGADWSSETGEVSLVQRPFHPAHGGQGPGLSESQDAPWEVPGRALWQLSWVEDGLEGPDLRHGLGATEEAAQWSGARGGGSGFL